MAIVSKLYRKLSDLSGDVVHYCRILNLRARYPGLKISAGTRIGKNCSIVCVDGAVIILHAAQIQNGCKIVADHGGRIEISQSYIGDNAVIVARESIIIKANCQVAEMVVIRDQNHRFGEPGKLITEQGFTAAPVIIEENVWLGAKVTVLEGSNIGRNTVVGAHSIVSGTLDQDSLYVGATAKKVKTFTALERGSHV